MYIRDVHILIEQGLQSIGVFAYGDILQEELDLEINKQLSLLVDKEIAPVKESTREGKQVYKLKLQYFIDRFQNLQVKDLELVPSTSIDGVYVNLPDDYLHLIADSSLVLKECSLTNVATGSIKSGYYYKVKGDKTIIYNGNNYSKDSIFIGVDSITGYTFSGTGTLLLLELCANKRPNRLTEEEYLLQTLDNSLEQTDFQSPVSSLSGNKLYAYVDDFTINKLYITYLRKAKKVNSKFTTYTSGSLVAGTKYESVDNTITYNGNSYSKFQQFTAITGVTTYTGIAKVRVADDGDLELTEAMSYTLIDKVIESLAINIEQNQQKIVNLAQENV